MNKRTCAALAAVAVVLLGLGAAALRVIAADAEPKREGYTDTPMLPGGKWHVHDPDRPLPPVVTPGATFSHMAPAPSDAVVLFDGKHLFGWVNEHGKEVTYPVRDGYMECDRANGRIRTRDEFGDFQLHLEFATPAKVEGKGQGRGNNGVNIYGRYEIQVLDSFENPTYADGQCGAIYAQRPPLVNASKPPGEWQTYDIIWEAPHWDESGKLTKKAYVTVLQNGLLLHHRQELIGTTPYRQLGNYDRPHPPKGPIELYYHNNPVRFRNIWIRPIDAQQEPG
jgi:hypothetical protein